MNTSDLQEIVDLCDRALEILRRVDGERDANPPLPTTAMNDIASALLDRGSLTQDVRQAFAYKDHGALTTAALALGINSWHVGHAYEQNAGKVFAVKALVQANIDRLNTLAKRVPHMVFYSWHSDRPNATNRSFIEDAIEKAIKKVAADGMVEARLEQGPQGEPGSKSLHEAILDKIDRCGVFVADVTLINDSGKGQCNSNVMYELGYATHALGVDRVVVICNTAYGRIEDLPFDVKHKIVTAYALVEGDEKAAARNALAKVLEEKFRIAFGA
jgi:hypothetical protein